MSTNIRAALAAAIANLQEVLELLEGDEGQVGNTAPDEPTNPMAGLLLAVVHHKTTNGRLPFAAFTRTSEVDQTIEIVAAISIGPTAVDAIREYLESRQPTHWSQDLEIPDRKLIGTDPFLESELERIVESLKRGHGWPNPLVEIRQNAPAVALATADLINVVPGGVNIHVGGPIRGAITPNGQRYPDSSWYVPTQVLQANNVGTVRMILEPGSDEVDEHLAETVSHLTRRFSLPILCRHSPQSLVKEGNRYPVADLEWFDRLAVITDQLTSNERSRTAVQGWNEPYTIGDKSETGRLGTAEYRDATLAHYREKASVLAQGLAARAWAGPVVWPVPWMGQGRVSAKLRDDGWEQLLDTMGQIVQRSRDLGIVTNVVNVHAYEYVAPSWTGAENHITPARLASRMRDLRNLAPSTFGAILEYGANTPGPLHPRAMEENRQGNGPARNASMYAATLTLGRAMAREDWPERVLTAAWHGGEGIGYPVHRLTRGGGLATVQVLGDDGMPIPSPSIHGLALDDLTATGLVLRYSIHRETQVAWAIENLWEQLLASDTGAWLRTETEE